MKKAMKKRLEEDAQGRHSLIELGENHYFDPGLEAIVERSGSVYRISHEDRRKRDQQPGTDNRQEPVIVVRALANSIYGVKWATPLNMN